MRNSEYVSSSQLLLQYLLALDTLAGEEIALDRFPERLAAAAGAGDSEC